LPRRLEFFYGEAFVLRDVVSIAVLADSEDGAKRQLCPTNGEKIRELAQQNSLVVM
jgi:hypothetical protein